MKHTNIINSLDLEQKCALLSGGTVFTTRALPGKGIPAITLSDGPNGVRKQAGAADHLGLNPSVPATCFPTSATVANSWDPELGEAVGAAMGEEAAAQGVSVLLGPGLNIKRSPLCGRNFEYFSEDPYLAGKMAAAYVRGIQKNGIAACPKHFAVNSQELRRMASDSIVDERTLREIYLTGFEMVVKEAQPKTIMSAYNLVNGTYANENAHLLMDILRRDWGFDGAVVTDWGGSNDHALGVKNGSTLEMPAPGGDAIRELMKAVQTGKITEADVDARLEELLELVFTTKAAVDAAPGKFDADAHHALARRAAAQSIVLLKNENSLLPLAKGEKVAVIGDFAQTPRYQGAGSSAVNSIKVDSFLDCLAESGLNSVGYAKGFDRHGKPDEALKAEAVLLAKNADVVLLCMGLDEIKESEGIDRADMKLAENQLELLAAVAAANPNVVVLLSAGSSLESDWVKDCKALVYGCLGGQAGAGALVEVLTGAQNPCGKLAETWARSYADTPAKAHFGGDGPTVEYREGLYVGYRYYDTAGVPTAFPFGYGLSYTSFAYSDLKADETGVTLTVTNTGSCAGAEIVQLYVAKQDAKIFRPVQELTESTARIPSQKGDYFVVWAMFPRADGYIQTGGAQIVQRAGGVPVLRGAAFHAAMQHAQLEAGCVRPAVEKEGQVAGLSDAGMADAVDHGKGSPVPVQHMLFGLRAEDGHVVGPVHGLQPRVQRVMVAVGPEDRDAAGLQAHTAVAQGQLGFDAVLFLIVDVSGQDEKVRPQALALVEQALQGREGGVAQLRLQGLSGIGTAQAQEGGVQMQVGGMDVSEAVHGVSLAWAPPAEICFFRRQDKLRAWRRARLTLSKPVGMTSVYTTGGKNGANPLRHPRDRAWPCHARADHRPPSGRTRIFVRGQ